METSRDRYQPALVSIITPAFNAARHLDECVESVLAQTYGSWQMLIVDDGSSDETWLTIVKHSERDSRIRALRNARSFGPGEARNRCLREASGRYVAFLDADDVWAETKLEGQVGYMQEHQLAFSFTPYELIDEHSKSLCKTVDAGAPKCVNYRDMLMKRATIGCSTVMLDRLAVTDMTMDDLDAGQDYALWLRLLRGNLTAYRLSEVLSKYRVRPGSVSRNKLRKATRQWKIYRRYERLSMPSACWCFLHYGWHAVFRR